MMADQRVRLGYIGAGRFSRSRLLPNLKTIPDVDLVAVSNSSEESSTNVAREFGFARVEKDWADIVSADDIDAVIVGTRTALHPEMVLPILDAGKHVLSLNAIARDLDGARAMLRKSHEHPALVSLVFPVQFYLHEDAMMRWLLAEDFVGQILHVFDYWYTPYFGLGSQFEIAHRWFGEHTKVFGYRRGFEVTGGGVDHQQREVRPESNLVQAELENGATITYVHSTIAGGSALSRFEIYGDKGVIACYSNGQSMSGFFGAKSGEKELKPIEVPDHLRGNWEDPRGVTVEADFVEAIRGTNEPSLAIPRFIDGVKLLEFAEAWRASTQSGTWVQLPTG